MRSICSRVVAMFAAGMLVVACASAPSPVPDPATPTQPAESTPTAPTPVATPGPSGPPSPTESIAASPRTAVWIHAGDLREPRNATNVVVLGTGDVLVVGSDYSTSWGSACGTSTNGSDSVEIGDPLTGVWESATSLPSLRDAPAVVALPDGRALLTGGAAGENIGWSAYSSTYLFDPTTGLWSRSGLLNTARTGSAPAVLLDGRVLVAGGAFLDRESPEPPRVLDSSEVWDPTSGQWSETGRLPEPRRGASAVTLADGRVLVVGGGGGYDEGVQPAAEVYDPASGRWGSAGTLATARSGFALVALADGGALVAGGFGGMGTTEFRRLSTVERFDPRSDAWSPAADLPTTLAGASGIRLADGRVLLAGGSARAPEVTNDGATVVSGLTADAVLFDPEMGTWTATTRLPGPRAGASAVILSDGSVVLAGGSSSEGPPDTPGCPEADPQVFRYVPGS